MEVGNAPKNIAEIISKTFSFNVGRVALEPTYWQAAAIVFLLFLLVLSFARLRHMYVGWSLKSFLPNLALGFALALIVEGFLIVSGRTLLTSLVGWENAPKPISVALDEGRSKLVESLGVNENSSVLSDRDELSVQTIINDIQSLNETDRKILLNVMCEQ